MTHTMTTQPEGWKVIVGVDTHKHVHVAVAIDTRGIRLGDHSFVADSSGYQALLMWAHTHGRIETFGIEGPGSYGAGLAGPGRPPRGASCRRSESGGPAHAPRRRQVRHRRCRERRPVRVGGPSDRDPQNRRRCRRDDPAAQDRAGYGRESTHRGDGPAEADRRECATPPASSPPRPHRSPSAHALRRPPTGPLDTPTAAAKHTLRALARVAGLPWLRKSRRTTSTSPASRPRRRPGAWRASASAPTRPPRC